MPDDNVIDFGSLKKPIAAKQANSEMNEMLSRIAALPSHMQDYISERFTNLVTFTMISARVAELLRENGYDPDDFEPEEETVDYFLAHGPFLPDLSSSGDGEDYPPIWNGPMYDSVQDEVIYRVATFVELDGDEGFDLTIDLLKQEEEDGNWQILVDGEWQPGPPDEYFGYLSMIREDLEDEEDWDDDEDDAPLETIYDLVLPNNVISILARNGIETIDDLCSKTPYDLLALKGIGRRSVEMIEEELEYHGLEMKK